MPPPPDDLGGDSGFGDPMDDPMDEPMDDPMGGADDKPFDDEPFDAGVEADEDTEPEKYIEQLSGKLGQSLRQYTEDNGQPDFELEKFAINSVISATHTAEMDEEDQKDIINKVKTSGNKDDEETFDSEKSDDLKDIDNFDGEDSDNGDAGDEGSDDLDFSELDENMDNLFVNPKKNNMFQPHSNDILDESKMKIRMRLKETFNQDDSDKPLITPNIPKVAVDEPKKSITAKNKLFFPNISYNIEPDIESYE